MLSFCFSPCKPIGILHSRPMRVDRIALSMGLRAGTFWCGITPFEVPDEFLTISPSFEQVWTHLDTFSAIFSFFIYISGLKSVLMCLCRVRKALESGGTSTPTHTFSLEHLTPMLANVADPRFVLASGVYEH